MERAAFGNADFSGVEMIHTNSSFTTAESAGFLPKLHGSNSPASIHRQTDLLNYLPAGSHFFYNKQRSER